MTTQLLDRRRSDLKAASSQATTWIRPLPAPRWTRLPFRVALVISVPVMLILCALLVWLAQLGQGEAQP